MATAAASATAASHFAANRFVTARLLLSLRRRRIVATRGTGKYGAAVRKLGDADVAGLRAVLRHEALNRDRVAVFQRILAPAVPRQGIGSAPFALPRLHSSLGVLHIQVHPDMWIHPLE